MRGRGHHFGKLARKAAAVDGEKAQRAARNVLLNAKHLDNLTPESFANSWGLRLATAEEMLAAERARRNG